MVAATNKRIVIEPVTRVEGHGKVSILLDENNQVTQARLHIVEFRGFERFIQGRPYWELPVLVQRLCGICPVSHHLAAAKAVDKGKALEMMFKGLQLSAQEALQIGLVHSVLPQAELEERAQDYAARLARQATGAIARIKRCVNTGLREGLARGLAEERKAVVENFESPDVREGVDAFLEGRKPDFRG